MLRSSTNFAITTTEITATYKSQKAKGRTNRLYLYCAVFLCANIWYCATLPRPKISPKRPHQLSKWFSNFQKMVQKWKEFWKCATIYFYKKRQLQLTYKKARENGGLMTMLHHHPPRYTTARFNNSIDSPKAPRARLHLWQSQPLKISLTTSWS